MAAPNPTKGFFRALGLFTPIPDSSTSPNFHSDLIRGLIKIETIDRGRLTCSFTVKPSVTNPYNTLHGGAVAAVTETVAEACARTVAGDKELFLGELSTTYLSAGRLNAEIEVDACILRQGRSVIVTTVEFKIKETGTWDHLESSYRALKAI